MTAWDPDRRRAFLEGMMEFGNVAQACEFAGVSRTHAYELRKSDENFAAAWDAASEVVTDRLEGEALRRAINGERKPVYFNGSEIGHYVKYDNNLLFRMLSSRRPEVYSERRKVEATVDTGGSLSTALVDLIHGIVE